MGGYGSGRTKDPNAKRLVDDCHRLSVQQLYRSGFLEHGNHELTLEGCRGPESLAWEVDSTGITLRLWRTESGAVIHTLELDIAWTPCHFGGERPWFLCPLEKCGKKVGVLYWHDGRWACRQCQNLVYSTQREDRTQRAVRRANRIRERLGAPLGVLSPADFQRPRGMQDRTFQRLRWQYLLDARLVLSGLAQQLGVELPSNTCLFSADKIDTVDRLPP